MRASAVCAALVLAAFAAAGAHARSRAGCPAPAPARSDPEHGYELDVFGATGYVADTKGRIGNDIPGANADSFLIDFRPNDMNQLGIAAGTNSYIVHTVANKNWPVTFVLSHRFDGPTGEYLASDAASWFLPRELNGARISMAFASGEQLADIRLCVNGNSLRATSIVRGIQAIDEDPPIVSSSVASAGSGRRRVTLRARDARSGLAGIWYLVYARGVQRAIRYRAPLVVPRGTVVIYWAVDRVGNTTNYEVKAR
ncbi:MAG TPA: hypothetical protein VNH45_00760 [Gaiellaceae bacterium]|jgi:hypothetical protein|nr:hypothetical protein [Gaiellaceae bacterium]